MPNPPGANPLVAERAPWRSSQSCVTGGPQPIGNPYRFLCHFFCTPGNPCETPIVTRGEGPFSYQGVSTSGVRHAPGFEIAAMSVAISPLCLNRFRGDSAAIVILRFGHLSQELVFGVFFCNFGNSMTTAFFVNSNFFFSWVVAAKITPNCLKLPQIGWNCLKLPWLAWICLKRAQAIAWKGPNSLDKQ